MSSGNKRQSNKINKPVVIATGRQIFSIGTAAMPPPSLCKEDDSDSRTYKKSTNKFAKVGETTPMIELEKTRILNLIQKNVDTIEEDLDDYETSYTLSTEKYRLYVEKNDGGSFSANLRIEEIGKIRYFPQADSEEIYLLMRSCFRDNKKKSIDIVTKYLMDDSDLA